MPSKHCQEAFSWESVCWPELLKCFLSQWSPSFQISLENASVSIHFFVLIEDSSLAVTQKCPWRCPAPVVHGQSTDSLLLWKITWFGIDLEWYCAQCEFDRATQRESWIGIKTRRWGGGNQTDLHVSQGEMVKEKSKIIYFPLEIPPAVCSLLSVSQECRREKGQTGDERLL